MAYNNELAKALRQHEAKFKNLIRGKVLQVKGSKTIQDKTWDDSKKQWMRDENGQFIPRENTAYDFSVIRSAFTQEKIATMNKMIMDYVKSNHEELIRSDE